MGSSLQRLIELFSDFPGIGPRQARRFAYFLLARSPSYRKQFIKEIEKVSDEISVCQSCYRYFPKRNIQQTNCDICVDSRRDPSILMIVSQDIDLESVERTHAFEGYYFILGGSIPLTEKYPEKRIRGSLLITTVDKKIKSKFGLKEVILALDANPEGDHTTEYVKNLLSPLSKKHHFKISILGRGLSTGTELEYSDPDTLIHALRNRE